MALNSVHKTGFNFKLGRQIFLKTPYSLRKGALRNITKFPEIRPPQVGQRPLVFELFFLPVCYVDPDKVFSLPDHRQLTLIGRLKGRHLLVSQP